MSIFSKALKLLALTLIFQTCNQVGRKDKTISIELNNTLQYTIDSMAEIDQIPFKLLSNSTEHMDSILELQTNIFKNNCELAQQIFSKNGYPGFDLVGEQTSKNYWLIVQHCDSFPKFQIDILEAMRQEVSKNNANAKNFAFLFDRVRINSCQQQVYGTQVQYDLEKGVAFPKTLENQKDINEIRAEIGLEPLEKYLERLTKLHREMNRERYEKRGILKRKER